MSATTQPDTRIGPLLSMQFELTRAARAWNAGEAVTAKVQDIRRRALELNHERYVAHIPAYRDWAEQFGLTGSVGFEQIVNDLAFTGAFFKTYPREWLDEGRFPELTRWLSDRFIRRLPDPPGDLRSLGEWQQWLRGQGAHVSMSSGTSGKLSFIARDGMTLKAWRDNARTFSYRDWWGDAQQSAFDCLVCGFQGESLGIQGVATGFAHHAARQHTLCSRPLTLHGAGDTRASQAVRADEFAAAAEFLREATQDGRPVLVFGVPALVNALCDWLQQNQAVVALPEGSLVATGGGWKTFAGERIGQQALRRKVAQTCGVPPASVMDAYSSTELNAALLSCAEGRYHIPPLLEPVIYSSALLAEPGVGGSGILGMFDPFAASYPCFLITGDLATLTDEPCPCGRQGWSLVGEISRAPTEELKGCGGVLASYLA